MTHDIHNSRIVILSMIDITGTMGMMVMGINMMIIDTMNMMI